jgi:hypothetical protein
VVRRSLDPDGLAARSPAAAAVTTPPLARLDVRAALARLALPLAVAALAIGVATPGAVSHALYGDEVASARIVTEPAPRDVLRHVRKTESTLPAWHLVAWGARKLTDADVASLRLLFFEPDGLFYGLARLAVTGALIAGAIVVRWRREAASLVAALGLLPIVGAAGVWAAGQPIFDERNLLPVAPFLAILVAAGVTALPARLVPVAAALAPASRSCSRPIQSHGSRATAAA